jgi:GNAT superfamily N-acetyltransferase
MSLEIREVVGQRDLERFVRFQLELYKNNPYFVPPLVADELNTLRPDRNPALQLSDACYWLAWRDGRVVGRIAAIHNRPFIEKWGEATGRFSWFDFVDDYEVSSALLEKAETWLRQRGLTAIVGPMGFTDMDKEGLLIEGFEELGTMPMLYNYPYYKDHLERCGYRKDVDWLEFEIRVPTEIPEKALRVQDLIARRSGVRLLEWKHGKAVARRYGKELFALMDDAYAGLYGTVPLRPEQVAAYSKQYLAYIDPRFTKLVVDESGALVCFAIAMPSLSRALQKAAGSLLPFGWWHLLQAFRRPVGLDMYLIAVRKDYQSRGVIALLMTSLSADCIKAGIKTAETAGELESNHVVQSIWNDFEKRQHKRRRVFRKML